VLRWFPLRPAPSARKKIAHGFNRGVKFKNKSSPGGTTETISLFLPPLRGLGFYYDSNTMKTVKKAVASKIAKKLYELYWAVSDNKPYF